MYLDSVETIGRCRIQRVRKSIRWGKLAMRSDVVSSFSWRKNI
jgi:hypothetical protein